MTVCVSVVIANGLAFGADSMTVVRAGTMTKHYSNADKLFEVPGLPIGVMTYGLGAVGRRTIGSLVAEWVDQRPPYEKGPYTVEQVARDLGEFVFKYHREYREAERIEKERRQAAALTGGPAEDEEPFDPLEWTTGLVIGGFQDNSRFPHLYAWEEPARPGHAEGLQCVRPHQGREGPEPGMNYWGDTLALDRLYHGFDGELVRDLRSLLPDDKIAPLQEVARRRAWPVLFEGMPLQDAADLVKFMLEVGCGFERFKEGFPQIGGDLDIAVLTRSKVHWVARKSMTSALSINSLPRIIPAPADVRKGEDPT